jgi:hypothetical protein
MKNLNENVENSVHFGNGSFNETVERFVQKMIGEGFYRYKPYSGMPFMFDGETEWSYSSYAESRQLIVGYNKRGKPEYLNLNIIDMHREDFPLIRELTYDITLPFGKVADEPVFNTAKKLDVKFPVKVVDHNKDCSIFWNHLEYLCGEVELETKEWVKDWFAHIFQDPNDKKGTALVFFGPQGCGKSIFFDDFMKVLLGKYCHYSNGKGYSEKFNSELQNKLLVNFDEGFATKSKLSEAKLKSFITQKTFKIEGKSRDATTVLNPARAVFTTNSYHAMNTAEDDRRFAVFQTITNEDFIKQEYIDNFLDAMNDTEILEQFMFELNTRKITSRLNRPPITEAKNIQKAFSAGKVSEWFDYIMASNAYYKVPLKDNYQLDYNHTGSLWYKYEEDQRIMYKENALESFTSFRGSNDGIDSTNKLLNSLKALLTSDKEWSIESVIERLPGSDGLPFGDSKVTNDSKTQRLWKLIRKTESDNQE